MKKIILISAVLLLIAAAACFYNPSSKFSSSGFFFDTAVTCSVKGGSDAIEDIMSAAEEADRIFSAYNSDSHVAAIENGEDYSCEKFPEVHDILRGYADFEKDFGKGVTPFCGTVTRLWKAAAEKSVVPDKNKVEAALAKVYDSSCYNGMIPDGAMLDFGSGAKGYFCDKALEIVQGCDDTEEIILSCGSSSLLWSEENRSFTTSVINPCGENILIETNNSFISTSGGYERFFESDGVVYSHIIDISSGYPAQTDIASVTVILPCEYGNGLSSDLLSTLIYIGGCSSAGDYSRICGTLFSDYGILIIDSEGSVITFGSVKFADVE